MNRVEFDSIFFLLSKNHVLRIVNVFYPIGIMQISLSYHQSLELLIIFCVVGGFVLFCGDTWLIELVEKLDLRPP